MTVRSLLIVLLIVVLARPLFAEKTTRHRSKTGEVEETVYEQGDREYRYEKKRIYYDSKGYKIRDERFLLANDYNDLGVQKTVKTFFQGGGLKKVEIVFRPEKAMMAGYGRIVMVYDKTGVRRRMEVYFTDDTTDKRVYSKSVSYYDPAGVISRTVFYFTSRVSEKTGYNRIVELYNRRGKKVAEKIYGKDGNEF